MRWTVRTFDELTVHELHALLRLRTDVFVVEQRCAYAEVDGTDPDALHVLGHRDGELLAYARILPPTADDVPHIGRVVVRADVRNQGLGRELVRTTLAAARQRHGTDRSALSAQAHLTGLYRSLGYITVSAIYDLDGIPHVDMVRNG